MPIQPVYPQDETSTAKDLAPAAPAVVDPNLDKLKALLASRKFWAALIGLVLIVVKAYKPDFPISEDQATTIVYILMAYIVGTAIEDHGVAVSNVNS